MADEKIRLSIPDLSLVVLIGVSSAGKSTFAREHFLSTEVLSADFFRGVVSDDENSLEATDDAFDALHFVAARRLARGLLTVVDATNVQPEARKPLVELAKHYHAQPVAIVFDLPQALCEERAARAHRPRLAPPRNPPAVSPATPRPQGSQARGFSPHLCAALARRCGAGRSGAREAVAGPPRGGRSVRHHRRCSRVLRRT